MAIKTLFHRHWTPAMRAVATPDAHATRQARIGGIPLLHAIADCHPDFSDPSENPDRGLAD